MIILPGFAGSRRRWSAPSGNLAPTRVEFVDGTTSAAVQEGSASGTIVGQLRPIDPNPGGTLTVDFLNPGYAYNGLFAIVGNELQLAAVAPAFGAGPYTVALKVTDQDGLSASTQFLITITKAVSAVAPHGKLAGPQFFLLGTYVAPPSDFQKWKSRGVNTIVSVADNVDIEQHNTQAELLGLWQIRKPRSSLSVDIAGSRLLAWETRDEPTSITNGGGLDYPNVRDTPSAVAAEAAPWRSAASAAGATVPVFTNHIGNHIWPSWGQASALMADYHQGSETDWPSSDTYQINDGKGLLLTQDGYCSTYQGHIADIQKAWAPSKPVFAVLETCAFDSAQTAKQISATQWRIAAWSSIIHGASGIILFPIRFSPAFSFDGTPASVVSEIQTQFTAIKAIEDKLIDATNGGTRAGTVFKCAPQGQTPASGQLPYPFEGRTIVVGGQTFYIVLNLSESAATLTYSPWGVSGLTFAAGEVKTGFTLQAAGGGTPGGGTPPPSGSGVGTLDSPSTTTTFWPRQEPTLQNTGYAALGKTKAQLLPGSSLTTDSSAPVYRSGQWIFFTKDGTVLEGYDLSNFQVYAHGANNCVIRGCHFDMTQGFYSIILQAAATGYPAGKGHGWTLEYCVFDGSNSSQPELIRIADSGVAGWLIQRNTIINVPDDAMKLGDAGGYEILCNYFWKIGRSAGSHPNPIHFPSGLPGKAWDRIAGNVIDQWGDGQVGGFDFLIRWQDGSGWNKVEVHDNIFKGGSRQSLLTPTQCFWYRNGHYVLSGGPIYDGSGRDGYDGPFDIFQGGGAADAMVFDNIELRDGGPACYVSPTDRHVKGANASQIPAGRPGKVVINSIGTDGTFSIQPATGTVTGYQYGVCVAGTFRFPLTPSTLGVTGTNPLTGTLSLISGAKCHVQIRAINGNGPGEWSALYNVGASVAASAAPQFSGGPTITGTAQVGQTLSASAGALSAGSPNPGISWQWYRADDASGTGEAAISGATTANYILTSSDLGKYLRVKETADNGVGSPAVSYSTYTAAVTAAPSGGGTPAIFALGTAASSISGTGSGEALTATPGLPAGDLNGKLLLLGVSYGGADNLTTPSGWTLVGRDSNFGHAGGALYKRSGTASETAPTITGTSGVTDGAGTAIVAQIVAVSGGSGLVDAYAAGHGSGTTLTAPNATSTGSNRLALSFIGLGRTASAATATAPAGYTKQAQTTKSDGQFDSLIIVSKDALVTGAGSVTGPAVTSSVSGEYGAITALVY